MIQDEIMFMARQAGFSVDVSNNPNNPPYWWSAGHNDRFEAFAKLVAQQAQADEREACAKIAENMGPCGFTGESSANAIRDRGEASIRGQA